MEHASVKVVVWNRKNKLLNEQTLLKLREEKGGEMMEGGANEVRYKIAEFLLKRMHEDKLLTEEEWEKIRVLNVKTFSPELAKVYL